MWSKKDSENLNSIAKSLERIADREYERTLAQEQSIAAADISLFGRIKKHIEEKKETIKVHEGPTLESEALEEKIKISRRMQNKAAQAERDGNFPFFAEALLDEEELETL